ncbi:hypothetical protein [Streptomyces sp. NPDC047990]|uniref:hypothetical protein n=1 Tax=Streptomyces sp. NPDC047990 TaxID=3365496 RepID=UPI0037106D95
MSTAIKLVGAAGAAILGVSIYPMINQPAPDHQAGGLTHVISTVPDHSDTKTAHQAADKPRPAESCKPTVQEDVPVSYPEHPSAQHSYSVPEKEDTKPHKDGKGKHRKVKKVKLKIVIKVKGGKKDTVTKPKPDSKPKPPAKPAPTPDNEDRPIIEARATVSINPLQ